MRGMIDHYALEVVSGPLSENLVIAPGEMILVVHDDLDSDWINPRGSLLFNCPCGCGEEINLSVHSDQDEATKLGSHVWHFDRAAVALHPSVRWQACCRAHFWIRAGGKVEWCCDSGRGAKGVVDGR